MKLRILLGVIGTSLVAVQSSLVFAQTVQSNLYIQERYDKVDLLVERATERITATSVLGSKANMEYRAGKEVILLPGFEAKTGSVFVANVHPVSATVEKGLELTAFPNPFEQITTISYYLPANGKVNLWIVDTQGKLIHRLVDDQEQTAGKHEVKWEAMSASSGVYLPIVESNNQRVSGRIMKK